MQYYIACWLQIIAIYRNVLIFIYLSSSFFLKHLVASELDAFSEEGIPGNLSLLISDNDCGVGPNSLVGDEGTFTVTTIVYYYF